jgi:hypothetical protein
MEANNIQSAGSSSTKHADTLMDKARQAYERVYFEKERVKFALDKAGQEQIINSIHRNNQKLKDFLEFGGKVAALREDSTPSSRHSSLTKHALQYWKHAQRLYDLLGRAWGCRCRDDHRARLYLQHRTSPTFEFCLLVLYSYSPSPNQPWKEQDLKIEHVKTSDSVGSISIPVPTTSAAVPPVSGNGLAATPKPSLSSRFKTRHTNTRPGLS